MNKDKKNLRGLYAITPDGLENADLLTRVAAALRGGARLLQYRDKQRPAAQQKEIAEALKTLCAPFDCHFIINDNLALAQAVDADGVHLGGSDGDLAAARRALGPDKILGASCYADLRLAVAAAKAGADYVAFGAVFPSLTKPEAEQAPLDLFQRCHDVLAVPTCAIGGITLINAAATIAAGADQLAVISDLFEADDIEARARAYQQLFQESRHEPA